ncbi:MAG: 7TM diverse intracellular signaling domain-containing protein [Ferruginibacter sp.]
MKQFFFVPLITFMSAMAFAQNVPDSLIIKIDSVNTVSDVQESTFFYVDSSGKQPIEEIQFAKFIPLTDFKNKDKIPRQLISKPAYLQFTLQNKSATARQFCFFPGMLFDDLVLYEKDPAGKLHKMEDANSSSGFVYLTIPPYAVDSYLVRLDFSKTEYIWLDAQLIEPAYLERYKLELTGSYRDNKIVNYVLCGVLIMMILFALVNYFLNKKPEFLYYCFFSICMFFLIFFSSYLTRRPGIVTAFFRSYFDLILLIVGTIFYLVFIRKFLDTKNKHPILDKLFKIESWVLFVMMLVFTYLHFATSDLLLGKIIENSMKILALIIGTVFIVMALKHKDKLMKYIAIGSAAQIFFSIISLLLILLQVHTSNILKSPLFYFELSIIMAIFFFLLGLTYKNRRELIEKTQEQEAMKLEVEKKGFETQLAVIKAQQEERNRISADMHDDLGAGMTTIRLFSELAKTKMGETIIPEIEKISTSADELLNKMNAIIWSMSSSNDTLGNMVAYIRSYALDYFENTGIACSITIPESLPELEVAGEIRRNVFLVVKETLNNIVKHSGAGEVKIILQKEPQGLSLLIHDNGHGIDLENIRQFGNGLKNMKKRMEDVGIEYSIENNHGTMVRLYRKTRD